MSETHEILAVRVSAASSANVPGLGPVNYYGLVRYAVTRQPDGTYYARPLGRAAREFRSRAKAEAAARATGLPVITGRGRLDEPDVQAIEVWMADPDAFVLLASEREAIRLRANTAADAIRAAIKADAEIVVTTDAMTTDITEPALAGEEERDDV